MKLLIIKKKLKIKKMKFNLIINNNNELINVELTFCNIIEDFFQLI